MTMDYPKYLKKIGAPDNDYHIWTPLLEARGDMLPFHPPAQEEGPLDVAELRSAIDRAGLSLSQAAREMGVDKGRLSRLLTGETAKVRKENRDRIDGWLAEKANIASDNDSGLAVASGRVAGQMQG